jgi:hypothetical protein
MADTARVAGADGIAILDDVGECEKFLDAHVLLQTRESV